MVFTSRAWKNTFMCYRLRDQRKEKLTARISFASLRLSGSESTSTSLYRVFRRPRLLLNFLPSMFPSSKVRWSCVQAAHSISVSSSVRAKRGRQHLLIQVRFSSVSNTDSVRKNPTIISSDIFKCLNFSYAFPLLLAFSSTRFLFFISLLHLLPCRLVC